MKPLLKVEKKVFMAFSIIPFLVGMLVAISVFRASGALDYCNWFSKPLLSLLHVPAEIVPLAIIRPISGNAALGMTSDLFLFMDRIHLLEDLPQRFKEVRIPLSMC